LLDSIYITSYQQVIFDIPQFDRFMRRTAMFQKLNEAHVDFDTHGVHVNSLPPTQTFDEEPESGFRISCVKQDWEVSSLTPILTSLSFSIHMVEHLYIYGPEELLTQFWRNDIKDMQWLGIFHPFISVKNLYLYKAIAQCIAPALQDLVGEKVTNVLPALESIFLEELRPVEEAIGQFVAARQLLGHPVAVSRWNETGEWWLLWLCWATSHNLIFFSSSKASTYLFTYFQYRHHHSL
jgi:hypothetical protein